MSMIKRGHSDTSRPSVISATRKCTQCGTTHASSRVCPACQGQMRDVIVDNRPDDDKCPGGICNLDT